MAVLIMKYYWCNGHNFQANSRFSLLYDIINHDMERISELEKWREQKKCGIIYDYSIDIDQSLSLSPGGLTISSSIFSMLLLDFQMGMIRSNRDSEYCFVKSKKNAEIIKMGLGFWLHQFIHIWRRKKGLIEIQHVLLCTHKKIIQPTVIHSEKCPTSLTV